VCGGGGGGGYTIKRKQLAVKIKILGKKKKLLVNGWGLGNDKQ
jgi:hypothetical protein